MTDYEIWASKLHQKHKKELLELPEEYLLVVKSRKNDKNRYTALSTLDHLHRGINSRNHWVTGLENLNEFYKNPGYFQQLANANERDDLEAMLDILIDFEIGLHDNVKNTDPCIFSLMEKTHAKFKQQGYDCIEALYDWVDYFKKKPVIVDVNVTEDGK